MHSVKEKPGIGSTQYPSEQRYQERVRILKPRMTRQNSTQQVDVLCQTVHVRERHLDGGVAKELLHSRPPPILPFFVGWARFGRENIPRNRNPVVKCARSGRAQHAPGETTLYTLLQQVDGVHPRSNPYHCDTPVVLANAAALGGIEETIEQPLAAVNGEEIERF